MIGSGTCALSFVQSGSARRTAAIVSDIVAHVEDASPGQHLVEHAAERPDVAAPVGRLPSRLFGTHVRRGAQHHAHLASSPDS